MQSESKVRCPKCGSTQIELNSRRRFGWGRGCLGAILFLPMFFIGFTKKSKLERVCMNCLKRF